jgi:hypothetical protein
MKKLALLAFGAIVLMTSCKKDEPTTPTCSLNSTSIQGTYKVTGDTYQADAQSPIEDNYATYEPCEKDDLYAFGNGILTITEGATSCNPPSDPASLSWTLGGSQLILSLSGNPLVTGTVESFTCNSMVFKIVDPTDASVTKITFTRQ